MEFPAEQLLSYLFVMTRCSGIFIFSPFMGSLNVPVQARILLSVAMGYLFALGQITSVVMAPTMTGIVVGLLEELIVGMAIGFAAHALFAGFQYAGQIAGFQIGFSFVNAVDPQTSSRSTTLSVLQNQIGLMLFLGFNGHHWIIRAVAGSLTALPPYSIHVGQQFALKMADLCAQVFVTGFQIAAPVIAVLVLTDVTLGLIGRSAPQIHILVIGFPMKIVAGIVAMGLGLYFLPDAMHLYITRLEGDLSTIVRLLHR